MKYFYALIFIVLSGDLSLKFFQFDKKVVSNFCKYIGPIPLTDTCHLALKHRVTT